MVRFFIFDKPYLFTHCPNQIIRRCVPNENFQMSSPFAMINFVEETLVGKRSMRRFFEEGSIGLPYLEMPISIVNDAYVVNKWIT